MTHAPAIIGVDTGLFADALGSTATLETSTFNSGTEVIEAIFSGAIDASFIGPNPAINGYAKSDGEAHPHRRRHHLRRSVARRPRGHRRRRPTSPAPRSPSRRSATPRTSRCGPGCSKQGYATDTSGGGDVHITPQDNADTLAAFQSGALDGAWVPEPWATRLVLEGGGHVLVNESDLWPEGDFVTTHLIVATEFLNEHPDVIKALIVGLADAIDVANGDAAAAQTDRQRRHRGDHHEAARRRDDRRRLGEPALHARPDRLVAAGFGRRRHRGRRCSSRSTSPLRASTT